MHDAEEHHRNSADDTEQADPTHGPMYVVVWRLILRTMSRAWDHSIFGKAATAAFWQTLSLPPLILGLVGSIGYITPLFGPNTLQVITDTVLDFAATVFTEEVVGEIIAPTVDDITARGQASVISLGFILSLWAGSSAISTFVDSIVHAHDQESFRNPIWQRIFSMLLYIGFLITSVFVLPIIALGPTIIGSFIPGSWHEVVGRIIELGYYPFVGMVLIVGLTTLYKLALHTSLPWHRLLPGALLAGVFFMAASTGLRMYLKFISAAGITYGALSAFIAFLLFTFFLGFAIVLGAEFNATVQSFWPARATRIDRVKEWITDRTAVDPTTHPITAITRLASGPIRLNETDRGPSEPIDAQSRRHSAFPSDGSVDIPSGTPSGGPSGPAASVPSDGAMDDEPAPVIDRASRSTAHGTGSVGERRASTDGG